MPNLAGIIYPNAFQVTGLIREMSSVYLTSQKSAFLRHKNLELGGWDLPIISNEQKTLHCLLDGKILNAATLRNELKKLGFKFITEDEQEVIIHAYDAWQEACLSRFNGPFSLVIFDTKREQLIIARDRMGQKSLYWSDQGDYWLFSTQMKGLLATGLVAQNPSLTSFATFLHFGYIPQDFSLIQNVNKLLPGHYININLKRHWKISQHYSLSEAFDKKRAISEEQAMEELGEKMQKAISQVCIPGGVTGSILSQNLGSTSINWFLSRQVERKELHCYSASFDKNSLSRLELVADSLGLSHSSHKINLSATLNQLVEMVWHLDEPVADLQMVKVWHLALLAKQNASYAISPLGWEELLAGHPRYFSYGQELGGRPPLAHTISQLPKWLRDKCILPAMRTMHLSYRYHILRNVDINRELVTFLLDSALFKEHTRKNASPLLSRYFNLEVFSQRFHRLTNLPSQKSASLYFDLKTCLPDFYLHQYNRLFATNNVTLLSPFLDNDMINFLASLPDDTIFHHTVPGQLLHKLMHKLSPNLPKNGGQEHSFIRKWSHSNEMRTIFSAIENGRLVEEGLVSKKWVQTQVSYPDMTDRAFQQLWSLLILEIWFRLFINRPIGMQAHDISVEELLEVSDKIKN